MVRSEDSQLNAQAKTVATSRFSLRRITTSGKYIPEIDGLRFVAISSVLLYHVARMTEIHAGSRPLPHNFAGAFLMNLLMHGYEGVRIFFVISGFVLGLPFAQWYLCGGRPVKLRAYFMRRITRLEPPYIANLLIRFVPTMVAKHMSFLRLLPHLLASLLYLHVVLYGVEPILHGPSWSLEIEVQFYLLAPLFALIVFRYKPWLRRIALTLILVGAGLIQIHRPEGTIRIEMSILNFGQFFLAGFLVADLYTTVIHNWRRSWVWDAVCIPLWLLIFSVPLKAAHVIIPLTAVVLCIGAFKGRLLERFFSIPAVSIIGGMCYSIYLTHSLVLQGCYAVLDRVPQLHSYWPNLIAGELLVIPVALIVGTVFFVLIERPCMDKNWPQKLHAWFLRRRNAQPVATTSATG